MDITELAKKACNRTRNANQWLAEGVPEKAKIELNDLGQMLADNIDTLQTGSKTDTEKPDAAAEGDTVNEEDEERSPEDVGDKPVERIITEAQGPSTEPDQQVS